MLKNCIKTPQPHAVAITPSSNLIRPRPFRAIKNNMGANQEARIREIARHLVNTIRTSNEIKIWVESETSSSRTTQWRDLRPPRRDNVKTSYARRIIREQDFKSTAQAGRRNSAHNLAPALGHRPNKQDITCRVSALVSRERNRSMATWR